MTAVWQRAAALSGLFFLAACAGSVSTPVSVQEMAPATKQSIHVLDVTAEAQPGVVMQPYELERIVSFVKADLTVADTHGAAQPAAAAADPPAKVKLVFTQYDKGSAFERFMLAGLGQIKIDADVIFLDANTGQQLGKYQVSKDFAFGGVYGGSTTIEDVEQGFAKSVAAIVKPST
ncbi:MAG TPA: DUF4410 domain-containing protein [Stellaceae bacterium]|nr:DUF4410 domain-containing protein [Stellaceae bacterium]